MSLPVTVEGMDITDPRIEEYIKAHLARHDESVLLEMEAEARPLDSERMAVA